MLCLIYVIFIIVALYYASHQNCPRMAATAATLRQIWSGGCQSCRNSEVSGLSGLDQRHVSAGPGANNLREACVCDVCPCAAIDVVVRTTSPVASIFDDAVNILDHVYCHILTSFIETYDMFGRVLECRTACRHQAQIEDESQYESIEKFSFGLRKSLIISKKPSSSLEKEDFNRSTTFSQQQGLTAVASGEIEATIAVERTTKLATTEKGVDMRFDDENFGTEEKGVGIRPEAESLPSSSHEGTSHFSNRSWLQKPKGFFQVADEKKKSVSSMATQAYCERCRDGGNMCVPSCPKNPHPKK